MNAYHYTIILHPDVEEGGYTVTVPALPGCTTQGETLEEAIAMAKDAIRLYIDTLIADGVPVPEEHKHPQAIVIDVAHYRGGPPRDIKFEYYRACPSVQEYVLVSTRRQLIEVHCRTQEGWLLHIYGPGDEVEFNSIDVHLPLAAIYEGTDVPAIVEVREGEV